MLCGRMPFYPLSGICSAVQLYRVQTVILIILFKGAEGSMRLKDLKRDNRGFALVEIMIVVAIIGLLAALAVPGFVKARKQSQGRRILNDCRQMDAAINQWALETGQSDGATIDTVGAATYLKTGWK